LAEFTGERVIPGQVDPDLWNEHRARYLFAARLCRAERVLDAGCGAGYGAAELATAASSVVGLDVAQHALDYARRNYSLPNLSFVQASAASMPFPGASFDLVVAFELIEHLEAWPGMLQEARRVLAPSGQFIVSTPNKLFYSESRRLSGPNPFHHHEFEYEEFRRELAGVFPHVSLYLQNHGQGIVFQPVAPFSGVELRVDGAAMASEESHFFLAVCALAPQTGAPLFVHLPSTSNVLRERQQHIAILEAELAAKNEWLEQTREEHRQLVEMFRSQTAELEERNRWAESLNARLKDAGESIAQLQQELQEEKAAATEVAAAYEAKVAELERENLAKTQWAVETERRLGEELQDKLDELAGCVDILHRTERTLEERTTWALRLEAGIRELEGKLSLVEASRWVKLGRLVGLGPEIRDK